METIFERGMATCFAYGQTGSGKTHVSNSLQLHPGMKPVYFPYSLILRPKFYFLFNI